MSSKHSDWFEEFKAEREKMRQLVLLCLETRRLSDEELSDINSKGSEIFKYLSERGAFALHGAERELRVRKRRKELIALPTEELARMIMRINQDRARTMEEDTGDYLPDSFFETPPVDSDRHIIYDILDERKKKSKPRV